MKMKNLVCGITLVAAMLTTNANAGLAVIDATNVAQAIVQVQNQIQQIRKMKNQLKAVTGNSGIGRLLNDPNVQKYLAKYMPKDVSVTDLANGKYDSVARMIINKIEKEKKANANLDPKVLMTNAKLKQRINTERSLKQIDGLTQQAEQLISQISRTTDANTSSNLANALSGLNTRIQLEMAKVQLIQQQAAQEERELSDDAFHNMLK